VLWKFLPSLVFSRPLGLQVNHERFLRFRFAPPQAALSRSYGAHHVFRRPGRLVCLFGPADVAERDAGAFLRKAFHNCRADPSASPVTSARLPFSF